MACALICAFSGMDANANGWTPWANVDRIYSHTKLYFTYFTPATAHVNPDGCARSTPFRIDRTQENSKEVFQMLLTAKASGLKVRAYLAGCLSSYPKILYLEVQ